jgi:hypothetical protein
MNPTVNHQSTTHHHSVPRQTHTRPVPSPHPRPHPPVQMTHMPPLCAICTRNTIALDKEANHSLHRRDPLQTDTIQPPTMPALCLSCASTIHSHDTHKTPCCTAPICAACATSSYAGNPSSSSSSLLPLLFFANASTTPTPSPHCKHGTSPAHPPSIHTIRTRHPAAPHRSARRVSRAIRGSSGGCRVCNVEKGLASLKRWRRIGEDGLFRLGGFGDIVQGRPPRTPPPPVLDVLVRRRRCRHPRQHRIPLLYRCTFPVFPTRIQPLTLLASPTP